MKVELRKNRRYFEAEDADFYIKAGETKELFGKQLKSYSIKDYLISGNLKVVEGEVIMQIKHAKVLFSDKYPDLAYGIEFGRFFSKKLDTDQIFWHANDEVPNEVYNKLSEDEIPVVEEDKEENEDSEDVDEVSEEDSSEEEQDEDDETEESEEDDEEEEDVKVEE